MSRSARPLLIWDFDGPIFSSRKPRDNAFESVLARFSDEIGACSFDYGAAPLYDPGKFIHLAFADNKLSDQVLADIEREYRNQLGEAEAACTIDREVIAAIENLSARCGLAILSLRSEESLKSLLLRHHLFDYFRCGVFGRDTPPARKPSPSAVRFIMDTAKTSATETVLIGDSDHDWETAHAAGVAYFHAGWSDEPAAVARAKADRILTRPSEIEMIVGAKNWPNPVFTRKE
jgi:phosphoglycolate phosphatase-like HAD superfamily hydrolase